MSPPSPARPDPLVVRGRRLSVLLLALALVAVLAGCARVQTALAVQPDDTVAGEIVLATPEQGPDDTGPEVRLPPELADEVEVADYAQDGYVGSVLRFSGLTFAQVGLLTGAGGPVGETVSLTMERAGGRVLVSGAVDLTTVSVDRADFQLKISFPGRIVESSGDVDSGTVSWVFDAGQVSDITAVVAFADPGAPSTANWTLLTALLVGAASAAVVLLARRTRNPALDAPIR